MLFLSKFLKAKVLKGGAVGRPATG